ncbi:MAG: MotA/TolQ/ExbB proton channel family protein, partial [Pseudomonadota bacterium]
ELTQARLPTILGALSSTVSGRANVRQRRTDRAHVSNIWPRGYLLQQWLAFTAIVAFAVYLALDLGIVQQLLRSDITRLSAIIVLLLIGGIAHGAWRALALSRELDTLADLMTRYRARRGQPPHAPAPPPAPANGIDALNSLASASHDEQPSSLVSAYLGACASTLRRQAKNGQAPAVAANLTEVFHDRVHASYEFGWFITNLSIRLGLLGTVIGFILMLRSAVVIDTIEFATVQTLLSEMTSGMGVALNTTLVGLVVSALLSVQYLWLDYGAKRLVADTVFFVERDLTEGCASVAQPTPPAAD